LGIYVSPIDENNEDDSNGWLMDIYKTLHIPMTALRERSIARCSPLVKHINICSNVYDPLGITVDTISRMQMFLCGYEESKKIINPLI
jgi:hypothetical protein